jgi:hypothetical protein
MRGSKVCDSCADLGRRHVSSNAASNDRQRAGATPFRFAGRV